MKLNSQINFKDLMSKKAKSNSKAPKMDSKIKLLIILLVILFILFPLKNTYSTVQAQRSSIASVNSETTDILDRYDIINQKSKAELESDATKYKRLFPNTQDISGFTKELEKIADEASIDLKSVSPSTTQTQATEGTPSSGFLEYTVQLEIGGGEDSIIQFVYELNNADRKFNVNNVSYLFDDDGYVSGANITIVIYSWSGWGVG